MIDFLINMSIKTGVMIIPLFLSGLLAWFFLFKVYFFVKSQTKPAKIMKWEKIVSSFSNENREKNFKKIREKLENYKDNVYASFLLMIINNFNTSERNIENLHRRFLLKEIDKYKRTLLSVKVLAAAAPLMGLLGTVNGMIHTFEIISLYGNANPVLMADGISEALLTTQSGLTIAFPILFVHVIFKGKLKRIEDAMSDIVIEVSHHKKNI